MNESWGEGTPLNLRSLIISQTESLPLWRCSAGEWWIPQTTSGESAFHENTRFVLQQNLPGGADASTGESCGNEHVDRPTFADQAKHNRQLGRWILSPLHTNQNRGWLWGETETETGDELQSPQRNQPDRFLDLSFDDMGAYFVMIMCNLSAHGLYILNVHFTLNLFMTLKR